MKRGRVRIGLSSPPYQAVAIVGRGGDDTGRLENHQQVRALMYDVGLGLHE
jgi:hypothetical protein